MKMLKPVRCWTIAGMNPIPVLAINGATASGKTATAVDVAGWLAHDGITAEIVNADSMLVYRGMDIGTAKPSLAERGGIVHHLIDIMDVTENASVAEFQQRARAQIADCRARGVVPILAGGSALYVHAILDQFSFPATDPQLRRRLEAELDEVGAAEMYRRLSDRAPEVATEIQPGNGRRIIRALEALELTGEFTATLPAWESALDPVMQFGLTVSRDVLDERIGARVDRMFADGLIDEVRQLEGIGLRQGRTASRAIGYRQVLAMFDGLLSEAEAKASTAQATRRLARKQLGWFRRDDRVVWREAGDGAARQIASALGDRLHAEA